MKIPLVPTIVFDLDGTLVDTVPDIAAALDSALARYGSTATRVSEAEAMMGDGLGAFFWRALVAKRLDLPAEEAAEAQQRFMAAYSQSPVELSRPYPGIRELLHDLGRSGANTAVCTNKSEPIALKILEQLNLIGMFDAVVGYRDDRPKKPDPGPLLEAISCAGGSRNRALMIGDSSADSGAATAAQVPAILVSYGYSPVPVRTLSAAHYVDNAHDLQKAVKLFLVDGIARLQVPLDL